MRQVWITKVGPPEVLQVREAETPVPGPGELRIKVSASGVNFADVMARLGLYPDAGKPPLVVGYEVAGVVDAVGEGVTSHAPGQRVFAMTRFGGYSDHVVVKADLALPTPAAMSDDEAAALPVQYLTAHHMLVHLGHVKRGDTVLIHAAAGGVGLAALQLCRHFGARTLGTASPSKHAFLAQAGLDHAIDYRSQDFEAEVKRVTDGRGADLVFDAVGGDSLRKSYRSLAPAGRLFAFGVSALAPDGSRSLVGALRGLLSTPLFHPFPMMNANRGVLGVNMGHLWNELGLLRPQLEALLALHASGAIKPHVDARVPFAEAAEAHRRLSDRKNIGKVLLVP